MTESPTAAHILVREPAGDRSLELPLTIGGAGTRVVIPDVAEREFLRIELRAGQFFLVAAATSGATVNAEVVAHGGERALRSGDVLGLATTRMLLRQAAGEAAELELRHLVGNQTAAPLAAADAEPDGADSDDAIVVAQRFHADPLALAGEERAVGNRGGALGLPSWAWVMGLLTLSLVGMFVGLSRLQTVQLTLTPGDAHVRADGPISWQSGNSITVWPGQRQLRAERAGYQILTRGLTVRADVSNSLDLTLQKLPGILDIDTGAVSAIVFVDGAAVGRAPGALQVSAGRRTLLLRAERHLDAIVSVDVIGMGQHQRIVRQLAPSWGRLSVTSNNAGAVVRVNDSAAQVLPANIDLPAGVHRLQIAAQGAREWLSSVLVKPGELTRVGPVVLGAPDAQLSVSSQPTGANVSVAGVWRGHTPLRLALPAGARYEVLIAQTGYQSVTRNVDAVAGASLAVDAKLTAVMVELRISGEPVDAEVFVDGTTRGHAPLSLQLLAGRHHLEVSKIGMQNWSGDVDLAPAVARSAEYRMIPLGRPVGWVPPAATLTTKGGPTMALIKGGMFTMGSARREQGRRPNEGLVRVTLSRPFYIGIHEVTNAEFRRFNAEHVSGVVDQHSNDLDAQAVTNVTWEQAVEYCNWLSTQEGLTTAYESKDGSWQLRQPANNGLRLPTEAEWEFAARMSSSGERRFEWGDELPVPRGVGNLAGSEASKIVNPVLPGYSDEYVSVAPVGRFSPNAFGLYDMTGNVSEWTNDAYSSYVDPTPVTDPLGPASTGRHTVRGSSWRSATISELRLAWREGATEPSQDLGFRLARYVD